MTDATNPAPTSALRARQELVDHAAMLDREAEELERHAARVRRSHPAECADAEAQAEGCRTEARLARLFAR